MKATYRTNYIQLEGTTSEVVRIDAIASKLVEMGYEDTLCGGDDEGEYWLILKTFCSVDESRRDYKKAKTT